MNYQFDDARGVYRYEGDINDNFTRFSKIEDVTSDYGVDLSFPATVFGLDAEFKAGYSNTSREREAFTRRFSFEQGSVGIPADLLFSRIDYIFVNEAAKTLLHSARIERDADFPAHLMVIAELDLRLADQREDQAARVRHALRTGPPIAALFGGGATLLL